MELNPYAGFVEAEDDAADIVRSTPERLSASVAGMSPEDMDRPRAPGKWSPREILAHLADCELAFAVRLRQTLAEEHATVQPFDQDRWAARYAGYSADRALETFQALRAWNLQWIAGVREAEWTHPVTHPERGTMTLRTLVETMAGHDRNHLLQLEAVASSK